MFTCGHCHNSHEYAASARICAIAEGAVSRSAVDPKQLRADIATDIAAHRTSVTEAGMYKTPEGTIYKVQKAVHGSGHLYAKRLEVGPGEDGAPEVTFEYAPALRASLRLRTG